MTHIPAEVREPRFTFEIGEVKSGSDTVLSLKKISVKGDDLSDVVKHVREFLTEFIRMKDDIL